MDAIFHVRVGWTTSRPVRPDEHLSDLIIAADSEREAHLIAALWTLANPRTTMPTSTRTLLVEM